jgi:LysM repeat protein
LEIVGSSSRSLGTIEKGFEDQLKALSTQGIKEDELAVVLGLLKSQRAQQLDTPLDRARALSRGVLLGISRDEVLAPLDEDRPLFEVNAEDVRMAAAELLSTRRRSAIEIYPKGWQDPWQEPMRKFHIVSAGENLGSIARQHGTTVAVITQMNNIKQSQTIYPGDKLRVPRGKTPTEVKMRSHKVRRGDTLSGLALKYGVSMRDIADANGMGSKLTIRTGETLRIPYASKKGSGGSSSSSTSTSSSSSSSSSEESSSVYEVKAGDTLSGIAAKHGVSTVALGQANGISHKAMVRVGQKLNMPPRGTGKTNAPVAEPIVYTVQKGDTLSGIAAKHGVTVAALTVENNISRKWALRPGQKLKIPAK